MDNNELNDLTGNIIGAAIEVHRYLGPGLLEHTYRKALLHELRQRGLSAATEVSIPIIYKGELIDAAYRADIIVKNQIILELKSTEKDNPLYLKQLLTYLRLSNKKLGLLINFNRKILKEGIVRVVNDL